MTLRPCVFLDRDGTLNRDVGYLSRADDLELLPGAADSVARLNRAGVLAVVVTNQSGIARGYFDEGALDAIHARLREALGAAGARLDAIHHSPYHVDGVVERFRADHETRKPRTGMIDRAAAELPVDRARSFVVGDFATDMELARNAGMRGVLVLTGSGRETLAKIRATGAAAPDFVAADLREATDWILARLGSGEGSSGAPGEAAQDAAGRAGERVVLAVGDFDPFRGAHVEFLEAARATGDRLVVAVRGDAEIARAGGRGAFVAEAERVEIVASLEVVDEAVAVGGPAAFRELLARLEPIAVAVESGSAAPDRD